jgi:hypothetical protein
LNVYLNRKLFKSLENVATTSNNDFGELDLGEVGLPAGESEIAFDVGPIRAKWSDGCVAEWSTPYLRKGFRVTSGDLVLADDFDRMWPDTWSGQEKIYFFSWDGTERQWKLPTEWRSRKTVTLHPLTPNGRGEGVAVAVRDGGIRPKLLAQVPYVVVPAEK